MVWGKRGSLVDIAFILITVLGLGIFILVVAKVFPAITSQLSLSAIGANPSANEALKTTENIAKGLDYIFLTIFVGLIIAVFISSFFIDSSPILVPVYIFALGFLIIFAVVAQNVYSGFSSEAEFSTIAATHPIINYINSHLVMIAIGIGVLSMILIFAKPRGGYQGGF